MKICLLGLEGAFPELLFQDERLVNLRRLMELGAYGGLQGVVPPGSVPGWICLAASQDPGSLGVYGLRNRPDYSYSAPALAAPPVVHGSALWDQVAAAGKKSIMLAVPPNFPPRSLNGISVGCFLTPDTAAEFVSPASLQGQIHRLVGSYVPNMKLTAGWNKDDLRDQILGVSRQHWEVARWLLQEQEWDYFHFVDIGLDRVQRVFWEDSDPQHPRHPTGSPYQNVIPDYCLWLDEQIGSLLELLDEETVLLLASPSGMQRLRGGFAINQWLWQEGLLVLNRPPGPGITSFDQLDINWSRTKVWADDRTFASVYFNVEGREPQGIVPAASYDAFRDEVKAKLETLSTLHAQVLKPGEIYRQTRNVAPDLMVQFGEGNWSSVGSVGHPGLYSKETYEGCLPGGPGLFVLTAPNSPLSGAVEGASLLDMAPTLLDLAGYEIPRSMQGRSLVAAMDKKRDNSGQDQEQIILDRLAGLGYV
ncbi:MAG: alkaline phosphatase family protein [Chlamydiota bacterium]